ncbi:MULTISPECIES: hypothetical protein [Niastella]|uniref:KTSC domain-containing protein n=1 Tax=Niastella soli TaxID=2821487 RepID=A0ABS3YYQ9_9BACT|nr:hypothetical protein [Niastella soli]MBO9203055.1 hypothetical protein [Niastella soli]
MWEPLISPQILNQGNKIRFIDRHAVDDIQSSFIVVRTDAHYFEILPVVRDFEALPGDFRKKVVRFFDIGYGIQIEVWTE